MKNVIGSILLMMVCVSFLQPASAEEAWQKLNEKDGIVTYRRSVAGSKYREFKAVGVFDVSMAVAGAAIRDVPEYPKWMENVMHTKVLKQYDTSNSNVDLYLIMDFPWPTKDRDAVAAARTSVDPATGILRVSTNLIESPDIPPKDGLVRLPKMTQFFFMEYITKDKTQITYSVHIETGGNLPVVTVEPTLKNVPFRSLKKLKEHVKQSKYASANPFTADNVDITKTIAKIKLANIFEPAQIEKILADKALFETLVNGDYAEAILKEVAAKIHEM